MSAIENMQELHKVIVKLEQENALLKNQITKIGKEKTEYLQNISHQLVAPLNAIKWHIENITHARIDFERAKKVLRSIYSQATLAVHLAKNFNLMSNLDADHNLNALNEPLQEVNLCQLLVNLADDFQPLAWERDIEIVVEKRNFENAPKVLIMKPLISQVFSNIIENAVKYSNNNTRINITGIHLHLADSVKVSIKNLGIPINLEDKNKIFERGFRSDEAKRKYPAGTGFGLYIAKRIIELHEGKIEISINGNVTIFSVTLYEKKLKGKARIRE